MKLFKLVILLSLVLSVGMEVLSTRSHALSKVELKKFKPLKVNEGRPLKSLRSAMLSDVHLAKPVKYFDIKQYDVSGKYIGGWSFDMAAYKKLSNKDKKKIRSSKAKKPKSSFWTTTLNDSISSGFYNLHYLDSHSRVQTINSRKELLSFLGTVDTPTELSMLFLNHHYGKIRYKKMGNIYNLRINDVYYPDCDGCGEPACTLSVGQEIMDNRGNRLLDRQVSEKSFKNEKKCRRF